MNALFPVRKRDLSRCPVCGSPDIEATGQRDYDADWYTNRIRCGSCHAEWDDVYHIVGHEVVTRPRTPLETF